jgi:predicted amidophosphoribosyltransferase
LRPEDLGGVNMFCPYCGKENADDARFCLQCGKELSTRNAEFIVLIVERRMLQLPNFVMLVAKI